MLSTPGSHVTTVIAFLNRNKALEMQSWTNSADSEITFAKCSQAIAKGPDTFGRWKSFTIARRSRAERSFENINGSRAESSSDACQRPDDEENSTS